MRSESEITCCKGCADRRPDARRRKSLETTSEVGGEKLGHEWIPEGQTPLGRRRGVFGIGVDRKRIRMTRPLSGYHASKESATAHPRQFEIIGSGC